MRTGTDWWICTLALLTSYKWRIGRLTGRFVFAKVDTLYIIEQCGQKTVKYHADEQGGDKYLDTIELARGEIIPEPARLILLLFICLPLRFFLKGASVVVTKLVRNSGFRSRLGTLSVCGTCVQT